MNLGYLCLQATKEGQASHAHVHEIINGLEARHFRVDLYEPNYGSRKPTLLRRLWELVRVQLRLIRNIGRYDVLYIRSHPLSLLTALSAKLLGVPTVQELNGPPSDLEAVYPLPKPLLQILEASTRASLRLCSVGIGVTPALAEWMKREVGVKVTCVVPNGANTELFTPDAKKAQEANDYVIFFGALSPWQGVETLLAATVDPCWPDAVKLIVVGDGIQRSLVEGAAANGDRISYLGSLPYRQMPALIASSIAAIIPKNNSAGHSASGLSPLKLYEALATGVPVIVTDIPGMAELVRDHEVGIVVPLDNPSSIAEAVSWIHENRSRALAMGQRARSTIVAMHSWDSRAHDTALAIRQASEAKARRLRRSDV